MLAVGIVFLFIITSVTPMVIGYTSYDVGSENDELLDNLAFMCYDGRGDNERYEYYKEHLLNDYSNDEIEIVEPVEKMISGGLPLPFTTGPINSSWPMKCHDLHHTGRSPIGTADIPYDELWTYEFDWSMDTSPSIGSDGTIYVGGSYGELRKYLFAINPDGTYKWKYKTDGLIKYCCPAITEDGTIYIGSNDDCLHAVNPDGTRKWKFDSGQSIVSSPAIGSDGTIYFGTMAGAGTIGKIFAINPDGTLKC